MNNPLRRGMPELPVRVRWLPVDRRGFPVPWFVQWFDRDALSGKKLPAEPGEGEPDFRITDARKKATAIRERRCWICGQPLDYQFAFVVGPMCAVNRTSAEPPSHVSCAEFAARACPFLARPHMVRREGDQPEGSLQAPGIMLPRNPGVALLWVARKYAVVRAPGGVLIRMGDPVRVECYAEGREATAEEIQASVTSGLPALRKMAEEEGLGAIQALEHQTATALRLLGVA